MGGSSFDLIAQELQKQYHIMEEIKAENRRLHQQLSALRAGQGIFVEINGTRLALETLLESSSSQSTHSPTLLHEAQQISPSSTHDKPNQEAQDIPPSFDGNTIDEDEGAQQQELEPTEQAQHPTQPDEAPTKEITVPTTFLEEIMLDEFAAALTAPNQAMQTADPKKHSSNEEQKATLRRELMGSFLLE